MLGSRGEGARRSRERRKQEKVAEKYEARLKINTSLSVSTLKFSPEKSKHTCHVVAPKTQCVKSDLAQNNWTKLHVVGLECVDEKLFQQRTWK